MQLASTCYQCFLNKTRRHIVWGQGNESSPRIMFIGEGPGKQEDLSGNPFVGKTGAEFDQLLRRNRINRADCYVTNLTKCFYNKKDNDTAIPQECIDGCEGWLYREIELIQPAIIVPLGHHATSWFLGDISMEMCHGIPYVYENTLWGYKGVIIPAYHPAAGLHNSSTMLNVQNDFKVVCDAAKGKWIEKPRDGFYADKYPEPEYILLEDDDRSLLQLYMDFDPDDNIEYVAIDTEWARKKPWCLTYSVTPGTARMIMADNHFLLSQFNELLEGKYTIIHNILYDWPVLTKMGIDLNATKPMDTMVMAYLLQDLPQGLKPLAYRIAGMRMGSYTETTAPASHFHAMKYMAAIMEREWPDPEIVLEWRDDGDAHIKQPQNIRKKVERRLMDNWFKGADIVDWWKALKLDEGRGQVEKILGPMQAGELCDIDFETAKWYASRDADATLRIFPYLWERITKEERE